MKVNNIYLPPFVPNIEFETKLKKILDKNELGELNKLDYHRFFDSPDFFSLLNLEFQTLSNGNSVNLFCYSLGSNLGLILANKYHNIENLILMSTPLEPFHFTQNIKDFGKLITNHADFDIDGYSNEYAQKKTIDFRLYPVSPQSLKLNLKNLRCRDCGKYSVKPFLCLQLLFSG